MAEQAELRFDGRVAIVTGAGRGVGRAHALELAGRGAQLVVNDLGGEVGGTGQDPGHAAAVAREIADAGGQAVASTADVASAEGARSIVELALERFGRIDVVVNNAGNLAPDSIPEMSVEHLVRHLDIHVVGSYEVTRAAWPHLVEQGYGRVVMTTSIGLFGGPTLIAYSTAKGGVLSLGRSLALAGEEHGIKVNLLAPVAETRMVTDPELRRVSNIPPLPPDAVPDPARGAEKVPAMLVVLAHERCPVNGETFGAGLGRFARIFVAETPGIFDPHADAESVLARFDEITDVEGHVIHAATRDAIRFREAIVAEGNAQGG